jgi:hypothetical protein
MTDIELDDLKVASFMCRYPVQVMIVAYGITGLITWGVISLIGVSAC